MRENAKCENLKPIEDTVVSKESVVIGDIRTDLLDVTLPGGGGLRACIEKSGITYRFAAGYLLDEIKIKLNVTNNFRQILDTFEFTD